MRPTLASLTLWLAAALTLGTPLRAAEEDAVDREGREEETLSEITSPRPRALTDEVLVEADEEVIARWPKWEQDLFRKLDRPLAWAVENIAIEDIGKSLADSLGVNVVVSRKAEDDGTDAKVEAAPAHYTLKQDRLSARMALAALGIDYALVDGALVLGHPDQTCVSYGLEDLWNVEDMDQTSDVVSFVAQWLSVPNLRLTFGGRIYVTATPRWHRQVEMLLYKLRHRDKALWRIKDTPARTKLLARLHEPIRAELLEVKDVSAVTALLKSHGFQPEVLLPADWRPRGTGKIMARDLPGDQLLSQACAVLGLEYRVTDSSIQIYAASGTLGSLVLGLHDLAGIPTDVVPHLLASGRASRAGGQIANKHYQVFNGLLLLVHTPLVQDEVAAFLERQRGPNTPQPPPRKALGKVTFDLDFPGGPIEEFLEHLKLRLQAACKAAPAGTLPAVEVLTVPQGAWVIVPPIRQRGCRLYPANPSADSFFLPALQQVISGGTQTVLDIKLSKVFGGRCTLTIGIAESVEPDESRAYNLENMLARKLRVEDVVTALYAAWQMNGKAVTAKVRYHEETKTLLCVGGDSELRAADQVMTALGVSAAPAAAAGPTQFQTEATVVPGAEANQYVVQFKISETAKDGPPDILSPPKLTVKVGEEGKVAVADESKQNGVFCTALVQEVEGGAREAVTSVVVKEMGRVRFSASQRLTLKPKP